MFQLTRYSAPLGLKWRSSVWFVTLVVGAEALGYKDPSSLTGYLLLAFAAGLVFSTPPITWLSERFHSRRTLLLIGIVGLIGAQILFMLAPVYWVLVVARFLQGTSSTVIWTVGSALLCDTVPTSRIGQQFGIALTGLSFGSAIGPTIGGALYNSLGFHAPFIFSLGLLGFDLILRFLVIEKRDAVRWGFDPTAACLQGGNNNNQDFDVETSTSEPDTIKNKEKGLENETEIPADLSRNEISHHQSSLQLMLTILKSKRAMAAALVILIYGIDIGMLEPTVPLRFQEIYGYTSLKVGLVFMGATFPTIISSAIAGILCDKLGTGLINAICFLLALPWFLILAIHGPVALFIVALILLFFFLGSIPAPAMAELAGVARSTKGIGYSHIYGVFNLAYGIGTAIGPLVASQLYDHVHNGFTVLLGLATFLLLLALGFVVTWMGDVSLLMQVKHKLATRGTSSLAGATVEMELPSAIEVV
ncbi:hypothetical protein Clacol_003098 [Clathrus columnatus]|uniref:Major facilitator superfamily (MFS) profile domain-containing protein n=1 Tax=Clathrus columnatus TaxID=1419009 RepID=A0AAV5A898_9AGAM|nr:hypothetical protein Clacol_003098 [Clathrus columnatus]